IEALAFRRAQRAGGSVCSDDEMTVAHQQALAGLGDAVVVFDQKNAQRRFAVVVAGGGGRGSYSPAFPRGRACWGRSPLGSRPCGIQNAGAGYGQWLKINRGLRGARLPSLQFIGNRQTDREHRSTSFAFARHFDAAGVQLDQPVRNRQTQPETLAPRVTGPAVALPVSLEDVRYCFGTDAPTRIPDGQYRS